MVSKYGRRGLGWGWGGHTAAATNVSEGRGNNPPPRFPESALLVIAGISMGDRQWTDAIVNQN